MAVTIRANGKLRELMCGCPLVRVEGGTTGECLLALERLYPQIRDEIRDLQGNVCDRYILYVNGKPAYPEELTTQVYDNDEIEIAFILDGG